MKAKCLVAVSRSRPHASSLARRRTSAPAGRSPPRWRHRHRRERRPPTPGAAVQRRWRPWPEFRSFAGLPGAASGFILGCMLLWLLLAAFVAVIVLTASGGLAVKRVLRGSCGRPSRGSGARAVLPAAHRTACGGGCGCGPAAECAKTAAGGDDPPPDSGVCEPRRPLRPGPGRAPARSKVPRSPPSPRARVGTNAGAALREKPVGGGRRGCAGRRLRGPGPRCSGPGRLRPTRAC